MGSAIFVSGRNEKDVIAEDLNFFPLKYAKINVNYEDSSVTCSLAGMATSKAVFRKGLGTTLVNGFSEEEILAQRINLPAAIAVNTDTLAWPMGDRITDSFPSCVDSAAVAAAVSRMFANNNTDTAATNITRALIVLYNGRIIAEQYAPGFSKNTRLTGWSMTKSITSALIGILVKDSRLKIDDAAPVPEWKDEKDPRHAITIRHLLQQTSGLDFEEVYDRSADANRMLFVEGDAAAFTAEHPLKNKPGTDFRYSSGNTNILMRVIRQTLGDANYYAFPYDRLFYKTGMRNTVLEPDASGTFVGSSFCYATARDWARFGLLYFNDGHSNGEQLFPAGWVKASATPSAAAEKGEYGFQWWLNVGAKNNPADRPYTGLPRDMMYADGYEGQNIFVLPSDKLVVVRLGLTRTAHWGESELITDILKSIDTVTVK